MSPKISEHMYSILLLILGIGTSNFTGHVFSDRPLVDTLYSNTCRS